MRNHEYSIVGHSRARTGLYIALVAGAVTSGLTYAIGYGLYWVEKHGYYNESKLMILPISTTIVFGSLYFIFDKFAWKLSGLKSIVGVPDIAGCWELNGQSYNIDEEPIYKWHGRINIDQKYEQISVHLRTDSSESHSISAAIVPEGRSGFRLIYAYRNEPKPGQKELNSHIGHCELLFDYHLKTAEGNYFNSGGRFTLGTIKLTRRNDYG